MTIEERLSRLERENRRLRAVAGALIFVLTAGLGLGMAMLACNSSHPLVAPSDVLRAKRLEIVNEKGTPVVVLQADSRGYGRFVTSDDAGTQLVQLASTDDGGTVAVTNRRGQIRAALGITKQDAGSVFTFGTNNDRLLAMGVAGSGLGALFSNLPGGQLRQMWP